MSGVRDKDFFLAAELIAHPLPAREPGNALPAKGPDEWAFGTGVASQIAALVDGPSSRNSHAAPVSPCS